MAIAKMKKVTLISFHEKKEQLLTAIQTLQSLEVIDLPAAKENLQSLSPKERESIEQNIKKNESYLENVTEALSFLKSYLKKESLIKQYTNPRQSLSLEELEKAVGEFSSDKVLDKVLGLKAEQKKLEDDKKHLYEQEDFLLLWKKLSFNPRDTEAFEHIAVKVGTIPQTLSNDYITNVTSIKVKSLAISILKTSNQELKMEILLTLLSKLVIQCASQEHSVSRLCQEIPSPAKI